MIRLCVFALIALGFQRGLAANPPPNCTVEGISRQCEVLKANSTTQWIYLPDGTYFRNPEYDGTWRTVLHASSYNQPRISQARRGRLEELVETVRGGMVRRILNGRQFDQVSDAEKSEIRRLRSVKFDVNQSINDRSTVCESGTPNAYYSGDTNRLTICPTGLMMPDLALVALVGHELGHSIDPCAVTFADDRAGASAIPAADYPQKSEMECFANQGFLQPTSEESMIERARPFVLADFDVDPPGAAEFWTAHKGELDAWVETIRARSMCYNSESSEADGYGNSIRETMGDMWSGRALADYRKDHPQADSYEPFTMFAFYAHDLCGPNADASARNTGLVHPPLRRRLDGILLSNPDLQRILGCRAVQTICDRGPAPAAVVPSESSAPAAQ